MTDKQRRGMSLLASMSEEQRKRLKAVMYVPGLNTGIIGPVGISDSRDKALISAFTHKQPIVAVLQNEILQEQLNESKFNKWFLNRTILGYKVPGTSAKILETAGVCNYQVLKQEYELVLLKKSHKTSRVRDVIVGVYEKLFICAE